MNTNFKKRMGLLKSKFIYSWSFFHQKRLNKFYGELLSECDLCFDIGAHLGDRSRCFLNLGKRVVAVEPQAIFAKKLRENLGENPKFFLEEIGVGAENGTAKLQISSLHPTVSTIANDSWQNALNSKANNRIEWDETVEIEVQKLDKLIVKHGVPDFCKIDVEGFELEVLKGLSQPLKLLSVEFFSFTFEQTMACLDQIARLGEYQFNLSIGDSMKMEFDHLKSRSELIDFLKPLQTKTITGDIYAYFQFNG